MGEPEDVGEEEIVSQPSKTAFVRKHELSFQIQLIQMMNLVMKKRKQEKILRLLKKKKELKNNLVK